MPGIASVWIVLGTRISPCHLRNITLQNMYIYIHVQFIFYVISLSEWVLGHMVFVLHNTSRMEAMSYSSSACFSGLLGTKGYIYTSRCYLSVHVHVE